MGAGIGKHKQTKVAGAGAEGRLGVRTLLSSARMLAGWEKRKKGAGLEIRMKGAGAIAR